MVKRSVKDVNKITSVRLRDQIESICVSRFELATATEPDHRPTYPILQNGSTTLLTELAMKNHPNPIVSFMHGNVILSLCDVEARLGDFAGDAVLATRKFLAVGAVADGRAGLFIRIVELDFVADLAAVAASWNSLAHFV